MYNAFGTPIRPTTRILVPQTTERRDLILSSDSEVTIDLTQTPKGLVGSHPSGFILRSEDDLFSPTASAQVAAAASRAKTIHVLSSPAESHLGYSQASMSSAVEPTQGQGQNAPPDYSRMTAAELKV
jgi:hypothetical protein